MNEKISGTVKWFDEKKGYGFVNNGSRDFFLHYSDLNMSGYKSVMPGQQVLFIPEARPKGDKAVNVEIV